MLCGHARPSFAALWRTVWQYMRDRLRHLHHVQSDSEGSSSVEQDHLLIHEAATASRPPEPDLYGVLQEAQQIRLEIQQIQNEISKLKDANYQALNKISHPAETERDSNAIGVDIKRRGEAALQRLHMMSALRAELEARHDSSDPTERIPQTQNQYLSNALQEVMLSYNDPFKKLFCCCCPCFNN